MNVAALRAYLVKAAATPARFGHFDCVRFVLEARLAGWGEDWRDCIHYQDRASAVKQLRQAGGLHAAFCRVLGPPIETHRLVTGDIAWIEDPRTATASVGLCLPNSIAVKSGRTLFRLPYSLADEGWLWVRR